MVRLIRTFSNGESLVYDTGIFDNWCAYHCKPDGTRNPPRDVDYFSSLVELANIYGPKRLYSDIKKIFILTGKEIDEKILRYISLVSEEYFENSMMIEIIFTILYAAFISEENKANTKLGKRIKFLGIHQILVEGIPAETAAIFSKGKSWQEISKLCEQRGF
jgi:hypothetical protein